MVDLGRPDHFEDAVGVVELFDIGNHFQAGPQSLVQFPLFTTDASPMLYRVRHVSIFGAATAGAGGFVLTFEGVTSAATGPPWPTGGPLVAAADVQVNQNENYHYTWSTEIADNYSNLDADFGRVWVGGLPMLYLPKLTTFAVVFSAKGGYVGDFQIQDGHMQYERFQADTVTGAGGTAETLYLLPGTG